MGDFAELQAINQALSPLITRLEQLRDRYRHNIAVGRNLSLMITHLEDAQSRGNRAQTPLLDAWLDQQGPKKEEQTDGTVQNGPSGSQEKRGEAGERP